MGELRYIVLRLGLADCRNQRIGPFGYDSKGRTLFLLDDMRLYRRTDPPPPPPPQKAKAKAKPRKSRGSRSSKRRKTSTPEPEEHEEEEELTEIAPDAEEEDDGFGGMKWECVCITLEDYQDYLNSIRKSRHPDEKQLYKDIEADIIPELSKVAEAQARKEAKKMKELETLQKLATAKRSSRISAKMDKQKEIEQAEEADRKRREEIAMAKAEQQKQQKMEEVSPASYTALALLNFNRHMSPAGRPGSNASASVKHKRFYRKRTYESLRKIRRS